MKCIKSIIITGISCGFAVLANAGYAQVVGGAPKGGGSSAVADHPSPSPAAAIESAAQTNQKTTNANLGQNGYSTGDKKAVEQNKAEDSAKSKAKKQTKHSNKSDSSSEAAQSSSPASSPKAEDSPH